MQKVLEKNGKNIILGHIAFCIAVFQEISVYLWPARCTKSENNSFYLFSLKAILLHFLLKIAFSEKLTPIL